HLSGASQQESAQAEAAMVGTDHQRLENERVNRLAALGLEQIGNAEGEADQLALLLGEQDQFGTDVRTDRRILGKEVLKADRRIQEVVAQPRKWQGVATAQLLVAASRVKRVNRDARLPETLGGHLQARVVCG